jgi:hypothetical protein
MPDKVEIPVKPHPAVGRLIRWRDVGDDPNPHYVAGGTAFADDVKALLVIAGYGGHAPGNPGGVALPRIQPRPDGTDLGPDDTMQWGGMVIKRKKDMHGWDVNIGYVVTEAGCNAMPGATWFRSVADAQKGIAALKLARLIAPRKDGDGCDGDTFWMLMQLSGPRD